MCPFVSEIADREDHAVGLSADWRVKLLAALVVVLQAGAATFAGADPRFEAELELGAAWQQRNDVEIPNDGSATRFSLDELVGQGPFPAGRFYFTWNIHGRHGLRVLLAPFEYTADGAFDDTVRFADETFDPGVMTDATYRFNSWRVSYRYRFHDGPRWRWWVGFTGKMRDAEIRLEQPGKSASDTDLGFVPLLHLAGHWRFAERWRLILDLDALAGGPGRAEDVAIKVAFDVTDRWSVAAGYRTLEGGADVEDVYNFAWFHFAVVSGAFRF